MLHFVKSLKLTFERPTGVIVSDDYGYPTMIHTTTRYSVVIKTYFGDMLYSEALRECRQCIGKLVKVESIFTADVVKTNVHKPKTNWDMYIDEDGCIVL